MPYQLPFPSPILTMINIGHVVVHDEIKSTITMQDEMKIRADTVLQHHRNSTGLVAFFDSFCAFAVLFVSPCVL